MRLILTAMISANSLSAFSGANTTTPLQRSGPVRLVGDQRDASSPAAALLLGKQGLPGTAPSGYTPRGSLLNLSV